MLSWPRAERKVSRLVSSVDLEDLHDQIDSLRSYVNELAGSAGKSASRRLRPRPRLCHRGSP